MGKHSNGYKKAAMMRGMCHSPSATAICSSNGVRSVIVPRPGPANAKYSRLVEPSSNRPPRSVLLSSTIARTRPPLPPQAPSTLPKPVGIQPHQLQLVPLTPSTVFQVVVLRVSLHCQGCAGKLKKHLSKMEGVTSFSIDLETKRVTVMGHITPNGVLESISKVKRAELWTSC